MRCLNLSDSVYGSIGPIIRTSQSNHTLSNNSRVFHL